MPSLWSCPICDYQFPDPQFDHPRCPTCLIENHMVYAVPDLSRYSEALATPMWAGGNREELVRWVSTVIINAAKYRKPTEAAFAAAAKRLYELRRT